MSNSLWPHRLQHGAFPVLHYLPELDQTHVHESVMPSNHRILCHPLLLLPSIFQDCAMWSTRQNCGQTPGAESGCWPTAGKKQEHHFWSHKNRILTTNHNKPGWAWIQNEHHTAADTLWSPEQRIQLSLAQTPEQWELGDNKFVLF